MIPIFKKELAQFFSSLTGFIFIGLFLLLSSLLLLVIPSTVVLDYNIINNNYATLTKFFKLAPWLLIVLTPAITMRLLADEYKQGTFEILTTLPLTTRQILLGKYLSAIGLVTIALLPTILYVIAVKALSTSNGIDAGSTIGAYIGLYALAAIFVAIGLYCSSLTSNAVAAFLYAVLGCLLFYYLCTAISNIPFFSSGADYYIQLLGLDYHYTSISRGVIKLSSIIYFGSAVALFLALTYRSISQHKK